jgi:hypothetical protein
MAIGATTEFSGKYMKLQYLASYARTHARIYFVLIELSPAYGEARRAYDQTHASYGQAHGLKRSIIPCKLLKYRQLNGMAHPL